MDSRGFQNANYHREWRGRGYKLGRPKFAERGKKGGLASIYIGRYYLGVGRNDASASPEIEMTNRDVYAKVFGNIVDEMAKGNLPWSRPWKGGMPYNAASGRRYSGGNVIALWFTAAARGWKDLGFVTFKQALSADCVVRKGEKGTAVYYMSRVEKKEKESGEKETYFLAKWFVVFNVEQLDELKPGALEKLAKPSAKVDAVDEAEEMVAATGAQIRFDGSQDKAYYSPVTDSITMPIREAFNSTSGFYGTLFHELTHWTGTASRCNRNLSGKFGQADYAFEELVAEIGAAFLSARFGMESVTQSAAYLQSWVKGCREHPELLARAASLAQAAADFVTGEQEAPVGAVA